MHLCVPQYKYFYLCAVAKERRYYTSYNAPSCFHYCMFYIKGDCTHPDMFNMLIVLTYCRSVILAVSLIVIPFLPASNIFYPVGFVIAERILYIPSAGYCLLIVIGFKKLLSGRTLFVCKVCLILWHYFYFIVSAPKI